MQPPKIHRRNMRGEFEIVKTLDDGSGRGPGALNGGVYVVRRKSDGLMCVEKRIAPNEVVRGSLLEELVTLRRLDHHNITQYVDAFLCLKSQPPAASLYMEYCQLGSLEDVMRKYRRRSQHERHFIPESFIWHTFHCLLKALTYLRCGASDAKDSPVDGWLPILHRDIKPVNVFIKKPDAGGKYPSVVLGDFGIAIVKGDPDWGRRGACGTFMWQPPEVPEHDLRGRGDVWSVGAIIQAMCRLDRGPVVDPPPGIRRDIWYGDPRARRPRGAGPYYSPALNSVLSRALTLDKHARPDAPTLLLELKDAFEQSPPTFRELPSWVFE